MIAAFSLLPIGVYAAAPRLARERSCDIGTRQDIPYRNDYEYFLRPWKTGYVGSGAIRNRGLGGRREQRRHLGGHHDRASSALRAGGREASAGCEDRLGNRLHQGAPAVNEQTIAALLAEHPVYVVSRMPGYCPAFIIEKYSLVKAGVLWRVTPLARTHTDTHEQARTIDARGRHTEVLSSILWPR